MDAMLMPELHVGRAASVGPLTVFPVWTGAVPPAGLVTGRAARVSVAEREGSPVVGELVITNAGMKPMLLLEGELLEGGWQHRVLQHDLVLAPGCSLVAAVACVEAGRWKGRTGHRRAARRASPSVRGALNITPVEDRQQAVWARVAQYDGAFGPSATSSYLDHLDQLANPDAPDDRADLLAKAHAVRPLPGQRGVLVGFAGQPVLLELFPSTSALGSHLPELLTGMLLDAVARGIPAEVTPGRRARRLVGRLDGLTARADRGIDAGLATSFAADTANTVVRGVGIGDRWAHLTVLNRRHQLLEVA